MMLGKGFCISLEREDTHIIPYTQIIIFFGKEKYVAEHTYKDLLGLWRNWNF